MSFRDPCNQAGVRLVAAGADGGGIYRVRPLIPGRELHVVASSGMGWEHVSVSVVGRKVATPNWDEMQHVRSFFWDDQDVVIQYSPRKSEHVNNHLGCLHWWRPEGIDFPTPDKQFVGDSAFTPEQVAERAKTIAGKVELQLRALAPYLKRHLAPELVGEILERTP